MATNRKMCGPKIDTKITNKEKVKYDLQKKEERTMKRHLHNRLKWGKNFTKFNFNSFDKTASHVSLA